MIKFEKFQLDNGLRVIVHEDKSTPMVAVNILYNVGSKDEHPTKTGFAHLFEHLMFSGSQNIPDFDSPLQWAGGESNAFTNKDITNFYEILPSDNIETAFWLESDRMLSLNFGEEALDIQRKVVVEEFKETCLNQPYGDIWHHLMDLTYKVHPYSWPTIGKEIKHIEEATLTDVKDFFYKHYRPNNAILVVSGNTDLENVKRLSEKWFGVIPAGDIAPRNLPVEPPQQSFNYKEVVASVPSDIIYMAFHIPNRIHEDYYKIDLLSDVLSNGASSRLYRRLLKEQQLFSDIDCYITGSFEPGLFIIEGKPAPNVSMEVAEAAIWKELDQLKDELIPDIELQKLKNKVESLLIFSEVSIMTKAMNLAFFELLGDANLINSEAAAYQAVTVESIQEQARKVLRKENCSELRYMAKEVQTTTEDSLEEEDDDDFEV
jgi:zinc protease